jgi:predicted RNase H-like HicB family nuclease
MRPQCSYPVRIEQDEEARYQVRFADLPDALTDGADPAEALSEAADCLSVAIASRIIDGDEIPKPSPVAPGHQLVSPDPTIALKAALYMQLRQRDMTVADLADRLGVADWHQAARLIDPRRSSKLTSLAAALGALGCRIAISVESPAGPVPAADETRSFERPEQLETEYKARWASSEIAERCDVASRASAWRGRDRPRRLRLPLTRIRDDSQVQPARHRAATPPPYRPARKSRSALVFAGEGGHSRTLGQRTDQA